MRPSPEDIAALADLFPPHASRSRSSIGIKELAALLDGIPNGHGGYAVRCLLHEDDHRSATLNPGSKVPWVIRCQRADACDQNALFKAACALNPGPGHAVVRRGPAAPRKARPRERGTFECSYVYVDEMGRPLHRVLRFQDPKGFAQQHYKDGKWISGIPKGWRRVLYRLPSVIEAVRLNKIVFVVEGEKDADALSTVLRLAGSKSTVTTCAQGAEKWLPEYGYSQFLADAIVLILPDNDIPGRAHAKQIEANLQGIAHVVVTLNLPGLGLLREKHGLDVSDWLKMGNGPEELRRLLSELNSK